MVDRSADQIAALAARHEALAACVEACATAVMKYLTRQQDFLIRHGTAVNDVDTQRIPDLAAKLSWFGRDLRVAGRMWLSECGLTVSEGWAVEPPPTPQTEAFGIAGCHALVLLLHQLRQDRASWITEATDAPNFLSPQLISMPQWATYVTITDAYAAAAVRKLELAYTALTGMIFRWMLDEPHTDAARVLQQWLHQLALAEIPSADRESVLADLLPRRYHAVAAMRQRHPDLIHRAEA